VEAGRREQYTISDFRKEKYFCEGGWTAESQNSPSGKSPGEKAREMAAAQLFLVLRGYH
jgi:hypothetical protein